MDHFVRCDIFMGFFVCTCLKCGWQGDWHLRNSDAWAEGWPHEA